MNRSSILSVSAAVLAFAAGYAARGGGGYDTALNDSSEVRDHSRRGESRTVSVSETTSRRSRENATPKAQSAPFAPGGAKAWLESFGRMKSGDQPGLMRFTQQCGRLDARSAGELAESCIEAYNLIGKNDAAKLGRFTDEAVLEEFLTPIVTRLAELDPARAIELMKHSKDDSMPDDALAAVFGMIALKDPQTAQSAIAGLPDEDRMAALKALTESWSQTDPASALAYLDGMADSRDLRSICIEAMAERDPDQALAAVAREQEGRVASLRALVGMNDSMRQKMVDWLTGYTGPNADGLRGDMLEMIGETDASMAMSVYDRISDSMQEDEKIKAVAKIGIGLSSEDAKQWIGGLPDGQVKQAALIGVAKDAISVTKITRNNIDAVLNGAVTRADIDEVLNRRRTNADFISPVDGEPLPGVPAVSATVVTNINVSSQYSWYEENTESWLNEIQPSDQKKALTLQWIAKLQSIDPERAMDWIETLPDENERTTLRRQTELKLELSKLKVSGADDSSLTEIVH